jgi:hypothetical protein
MSETKRGDRGADVLDWTEEKNARRCHLIDRKLLGLLTSDEVGELDRLQRAMRHHINRVAPLPFDAAKRLHAELVQNQQSPADHRVVT